MATALIIVSFCVAFTAAASSSFADFSASSFADATDWLASSSCCGHHLPSFFAEASTFDVELD
jgi:hypothetical protein